MLAWQWQWHQQDHMQIICSLLQADNHATTSIFYRPDVVPDAKPTVFQGTKGNTQRNVSKWKARQQKLHTNNDTEKNLINTI